VISVVCKFIVIFLLALEALLCIAKIGKPREPLKPEVAVVSVVIATGMILMIVFGWKT